MLAPRIRLWDQLEESDAGTVDLAISSAKMCSGRGRLKMSLWDKPDMHAKNADGRTSRDSLDRPVHLCRLEVKLVRRDGKRRID